MQAIVVVIHLAVSIALIGLILIQHGKGADAGAAFGSGASSTVFGAQGSGSFLTKTTAILATIFFISSVTLAMFALDSGKQERFMQEDEAAEAVVIPADEAKPAAEGVDAEVPRSVGVYLEPQPQAQAAANEVPANIEVQEAPAAENNTTEEMAAPPADAESFQTDIMEEGQPGQ
ncbi:MAG: preprotein translocase subunit SecG [gamma proteobacterium symbiont of Bathyaustriella thionipta]|nr:preprotein translocase subunit SecG [gamma proteobacterium symbiont of Bathyaustriella thionipta]